jgi:phage-related protein
MIVVLPSVLRGAVHVVHAFKKTTPATPQRAITVARQRLKEVVE